MSLRSDIMDFAEQKNRTDKPSFCIHEILKHPVLGKTPQNTLSSQLGSITLRGGLTREKGMCADSSLSHFFFKFNKKPEKATNTENITQSVLEYAKEKAETKDPFFCVHDLESLRSKGDVNASISYLITKGKIKKLFNKSTCKFGDRVHSIYQYNKPVTEPVAKPKRAYHRTFKTEVTQSMTQRYKKVQVTIKENGEIAISAEN
jgi:hypothetical protein